MIFVSLLIYFLPAILPSLISFLLNKTRHKFLKYSAPLISLIIVIIFIIRYNTFASNDEMATLNNLNNIFFAYTFGLGFLFSLIFCILKDSAHSKNKK